MQTKLLFLTVLSLVSLLSACQSFVGSNTVSPHSREQLCAQLKQQIIFGGSASSSIAGSDSPTEKAQLAKQYHHYQCTDFEQTAAAP